MRGKIPFDPHIIIYMKNHGNFINKIPYRHKINFINTI